jgi:FkbM family methyltransferase
LGFCEKRGEVTSPLLFRCSVIWDGGRFTGDNGCPVLLTISRAIKRRAPRVHEAVKKNWRLARLPLPKILMGNLVWIDSRLLGAEVTETHVLRWIRESLRPGDTFFDVGAHRGWMSLVAAKRVGPRGRAVAFEPSPPLVDVLRYHQRVNRMRQLEILDKAVSDTTRKGVPFSLVEGGNSYLNSLVGTASYHGRRSEIEVETLALDDFWRASGQCPTAIKIDVEGAELLVLRGAEAILEACHPTLIIAVHPTWMPQGQTPAELFALLRKHEYRIMDSNVVRYEEADFGDYLCVAF